LELLVAKKLQTKAPKSIPQKLLSHALKSYQKATFWVSRDAPSGSSFPPYKVTATKAINPAFL